MPNAPTKTRQPITPEGQAAAGRIAEFRQNVNNGATSKQARATVRALDNPTAQNQKRANELNQGNPNYVAFNGKLTTPIAPVPTPASSTISATSLAPATPMTLATPVPATQAQGMMAEFTDGVDTYTQNLQDQAKALEAPKTNALNDYITQLTAAKGVSGLTNDAYAVKGGVNDITPELNDINDKIRREQLSLRRRTEAINNNGGGLASGAQSEISNIERDSFAKQADLSIIQQAVQGRYDSAKEIADRAVSAQLEKQTNDLAILKFNYDENKELFTKAEQRAFESAQADRTNKLETERQNLADIKQFALSALQAGASTAEVQKAMQSKTMDEAINLVGNYLRPKPVVVDPNAGWELKEVNGETAWVNKNTQEIKPVGATNGTERTLSYEDNAKFNATPEAKAIKDSANYANAVNAYKNAINTYGTGELVGQGRGILGETYSALVGATKDYYTLGTFDNGVQKLISLGIPEPSLIGMKNARIASLDSAIGGAKKKIEENTAQLGSSKFANTKEYKTLVSSANKAVNVPEVVPVQWNLFAPDDLIELSALGLDVSGSTQPVNDYVQGLYPAQ